MKDRDTFYIGELARRSGASRDTIRYYESTGVLPEPRRTGSGYRLYGAEDVERLTFVSRAQELGLRLEEIAETLDLVDEGREPCDHVRRSLRRRLAETRARIRALEGFQATLEEALERAPEEGGASVASCRCPIIEERSDGGTEPA